MVKKRTRLGCLNCRRRRRKCDGLRPTCKSCGLRGHTCVYGLKASFHHSRNSTLSYNDAVDLARVEAGENIQNPQPNKYLIVDETQKIINEYLTENGYAFDLKEIYASQDGGDNFSREPAALFDSHHALPWTPHSGQSIPQNVASSTPQDSYITPFFLGQAAYSDTSLHELSLPVSKAEKAHLIASYLQETGTWCNTTDSSMQFTVESIHHMMKAPAFEAAAMALASRQRDNVEQFQHAMTLELYQHTVQLLIRQAPAKADASILAACTLLCVYEMMVSPVYEWRRHLKGCASLLQAKKWNGSSNGIVKSCFWAFARIDIWAAFISGNSTLIPTDFWLDDMSLQSVAAKGDIDDYCNLSILTFARIVNLLAPAGRDDDSIGVSCNALWDDLQTWYRSRPTEVAPLVRETPSPPNVFPSVVFSRSSSICGSTFYHAGSILLLQTGLVPQAQSETVWHARELAGISISNTSHANWVNQVQPLYIAGAAFKGENTCYNELYELDGLRTRPARVGPIVNGNRNANGKRVSSEEYATEKIILLKHLALIERETGWKTADRAADLRRLWGFG
ncbi:hypothetical protein P170DRAFT_4722 [Aspergillus steynii IBT 23096]|uniref:Zn(2)-C6 fungal-type domain-containing protein n=1 Tax=Aspergillus steynii IBT 23096 TaxID=1392250 RepID=A0A2I2GLM9_9EURO|nr:uncharacterized protein P170DRAFT_4722 [Aspergillus steynii IBT 23096]PLB53777.1 hypothetical protein P170DRAFT_4722 [Aspergillus steynii IBT 23096]